MGDTKLVKLEVVNEFDGGGSKQTQWCTLVPMSDCNNGLVSLIGWFLWIFEEV